MKKKRQKDRGGDKSPIITIVERKTKFTTFFVAKNLSKKLIWELINKLCKTPVTGYTDDFTIYSYLESHKLVKKHFFINHSIKQYASGNNPC
ncbi:MAG: transposase [Methanobrevibacter sp.]|nr:transposase [Candidatus Methanoflexus mossambicus]